jgi:hypothetical protein
MQLDKNITGQSVSNPDYEIKVAVLVYGEVNEVGEREGIQNACFDASCRFTRTPLGNWLPGSRKTN